MAYGIDISLKPTPNLPRGRCLLLPQLHAFPMQERAKQSRARWFSRGATDLPAQSICDARKLKQNSTRKT